MKSFGMICVSCWEDALYASALPPSMLSTCKCVGQRSTVNPQPLDICKLQSKDAASLQLGTGSHATWSAMPSESLLATACISIAVNLISAAIGSIGSTTSGVSSMGTQQAANMALSCVEICSLLKAQA